MPLRSALAGIVLGIAGVILLAMPDPGLSAVGLAFVSGGVIALGAALYVVFRGAPEQSRLWRLR